MKVEIFTPSAILKPVIQSYTVVETTVASNTVVLPHYGFILAIQFKGQVSISRDKGLDKIKIPEMVLSGIRQSSRKFHYDSGTGAILVMFREIGAFSFFRQPLASFFENIEPIENLFTAAEIHSLRDRISAARTNHERIKLVEHYLIRKQRVNDVDDLILSAVNQIRNCSGIVPIHKLAQGHNIGIDAFEKRFRKIVGATPKQFSNIVRIKSLIANEYNCKSLTDLGYKYEFYDQSHFVKQFKSFTDQSPKDFFKTPYNW